MPEPIDPFDRLRTPELDATDAVDPRQLGRPRPGNPVVGRFRDRAAPWIAWFGAGRLVAAALTVVAVVIVGWWLLRAPAPPTEAGLPHAATSTPAPVTASLPTSGAPPPATGTAPHSLVVHVAGAVVAPGVYELPPDARAADALAVAGGAAPGADVDALNLAAPVRDGERVYVPVAGEALPPPAPAPASSVATGPVDLNRATAAELDALPGIGPATAQAIVAHRDANGPFATVEDLEQVRGIGPAKLEAIRPLVTL